MIEPEPTDDEVYAGILARLDKMQAILTEQRLKYEAMLNDALEVQAALLANEIEQHLGRANE